MNTFARPTTRTALAGICIVAVLAIVLTVLLSRTSSPSPQAAAAVERPTTSATAEPGTTGDADGTGNTDGPQAGPSATTSPTTTSPTTTSPTTTSPTTTSPTTTSPTTTTHTTAGQPASSQPASGPTVVDVGADTQDLPDIEPCIDGEYAGSDWAMVISAPANSDDSTLPVYTAPDMAAQVWGEFAIGDTVALAWVPEDFDGCAYRFDGIVFWAVWTSDGDHGWVDSYHMMATAQPGTPQPADNPPADNLPTDQSTADAPDAHGDCMVPALRQDVCVPVTISADGTIVEATFADQETQLWATHDCIYGGDARMCQALTVAGYGAADAYGLGNSVSMAPSDFLRQDCDTLGYTTAWGAIACSELIVRHTQP